MKITKIDVIKPRFGNFIKATGCRVYTDEGIYGDGEAFADWHGSSLY